MQTEIATDVLVIGCGIAGCTAALKAADAGMNVSLITSSSDVENCNTSKAQGGIIYKGETDSPESLIQDIWQAGCQKGYMPSIQLLAQTGPSLVDEILFNRLKIPFDSDSSGKLDLTEEAAHAVPRIIHVADSTGREIGIHFHKAVSSHPNIHLYTGFTAIDLLTTGHSATDSQNVYKPQTCFGAYVFDIQEKKVITFLAKETVLATGGVGALYLHNTNSDISRGDGIAMAHRAGARIINMEYIQFHPTGLYHPFKPRCLLSESLRGEGAVLINHLGEPFMNEYHPLGNLAPRDVVSRAIDDQMTKLQKQFVYLDISHKDPDWIRLRFPYITKICEEYGYDITSKPVPVVPVAHYTCGGIWVDHKGSTSIHHLSAVGEVTCTGVHGANRLASTSLLEGLVWGAFCGENLIARKNKSYDIPKVFPWQYENEPVDMALIRQDWQTIKHTMWNYVGPTRSYKRLQRAYTILRNL
ncbi:MAG: FAD-dependent oxidoreductase, partial [Candidatus Aureabacteria bacterium]|nr:FAD-dependent oxidoreductase [Candidatus Auribacterota bacterium]